MKNFDFEKNPVVPPHCLWVSGLLLESGSRASAGVPRLHRARHTAGNRLAMGDKVPGAWGAPGTDPLPGMAAGFATLWAGVNTSPAVSAQLPMGCLVLRSPESLLAGSVSHKVLRDVEAPEAHLPHEGGQPALKMVNGAREECGEPSSEHGRRTLGAGGQMSEKTKVLFIPKPDPWKSAHSGGGKNLNPGRPISFCRKIITFSPAMNPVC